MVEKKQFLPWKGLVVFAWSGIKGVKNYQMFLAATEAWLKSHIWHDNNKDMKIKGSFSQASEILCSGGEKELYCINQ